MPERVPQGDLSLSCATSGKYSVKVSSYAVSGREYGTKSLPIHVKTCKVKWEKEQDLLPKKQRRPCPKAPENFDMVSVLLFQLIRSDLSVLENERHLHGQDVCASTSINDAGLQRESLREMGRRSLVGLQELCAYLLGGPIKYSHEIVQKRQASQDARSHL